MYWLWLFCLYSFLGYLLEKAFAAATGSRHQVRKCFLLLPLCPVYGLAMLAVLHLPADLRRGFFRLALYGGLTATAVEYAVHFLYDKLLGVMFWDYGSTHMDLNRRICMPFAVIWGLLTAFLVRCVQPLLHPIAACCAGPTTWTCWASPICWRPCVSPAPGPSRPGCRRTPCPAWRPR